MPISKTRRPSKSGVKQQVDIFVKTVNPSSISGTSWDTIISDIEDISGTTEHVMIMAVIRGVAQVNYVRIKAVGTASAVQARIEKRQHHSMVQLNLVPTLDGSSSLRRKMKTAKLKDYGLCRNKHGMYPLLSVPSVNQLLNSHNPARVPTNLSGRRQEQRNRHALIQNFTSKPCPILASGLPREFNARVVDQRSATKELQELSGIVLSGRTAPPLH